MSPPRPSSSTSLILVYSYEHGKLIEINSHSLFSKWFSESGKLVQKLFAAVTEMVDDESGFVVVLIGQSSPLQVVLGEKNKELTMKRW